jgi:hypothetical protein
VTCQHQADSDAWTHHARADYCDSTHVALAITLERIVDLARQLESCHDHEATPVPQGLQSLRRGVTVSRELARLYHAAMRVHLDRLPICWT